ncbi:hypothetical protein ABK040_013333 [Willaertia magna]
MESINTYKLLDKIHYLYQYQFQIKNIYYLINKYNLNELQLSFTKGRYNYLEWGIPKISLPNLLSPSGVTLNVTFSPNLEDKIENKIENKYIYLVNELSGLFCTSLNFLISKKVYESGVFHFLNKNTIYGTLNEETVCTENLSPILSILPYRGKIGLSKYLIPNILFNSKYINMNIYLNKTNIEINIYRINNELDNSINNQIIPYGISTINRNIDNNIFIESPISIKRYEQFNGYNNGKLITNIEILNNTFIDNLCIYDLIPFYFNIYIHTLKVNIPINNIKLLSSKNRNTILELCFNNLQEYSLQNNNLQNNIDIKIDFDKIYLKYTSYAPDANRGFDKSSSIIKINNNLYTLYSNSLLISLPTPDFSMPYNVITLTCTIIALFFGSMFNILIRRFNPIYENEHGKSLLERLIHFIYLLLKKLKRK